MGSCCSRENAFAVVTNNKLENNSNSKNPLSNNFTTNNISSTKHDYITPLSKKEENNCNYFNLVICFDNENVENLQLMNKTSQHMDIISLLNKVLFESEDFDVNFISKYDSKTDRFFYFIERIDKYYGTTEVTSYVRKLGKKSSKNSDLKDNKSMVEKNVKELNHKKLIRKDETNKFINKDHISENIPYKEFNDDEKANLKNNSEDLNKNSNFCENLGNNIGLSNSSDSSFSSICNLKFNNKNYSASQLIDHNKDFRFTCLTTHENKKNIKKFIWNLYIDNQIQNLTDIIDKNRIVYKEELLMLKYEYFFSNS